MSDIVRTNKEINIASGDFAKKLREALGQDEERGTEIAIRQERPDPSGVATVVSFIGAMTMDLTVFGKAVTAEEPPGPYLSAEQIADFAKRQ